MRNDLNTSVGTLVDDVFEWANQTFPDRSDVSMFLKMYSEIGEIVESGGNKSEVADLFILLLDYAARKGIDITDAVTHKLAINRQRTWKTDANGVNRHVE